MTIKRDFFCNATKQLALIGPSSPHRSPRPSLPASLAAIKNETSVTTGAGPAVLKVELPSASTASQASVYHAVPHPLPPQPQPPPSASLHAPHHPVSASVIKEAATGPPLGVDAVAGLLPASVAVLNLKASPSAGVSVASVSLPTLKVAAAPAPIVTLAQVKKKVSLSHFGCFAHTCGSKPEICYALAL